MRTFGAGTVTLRSFLTALHRPTTKALATIKDILMFCNKCGFEVGNEAKFCSKCGNSTEDSASSELNKEKLHTKNKIYYDNKSGIIVDSKVYNQNGSIYPINQISSVEILKNHTVTQETLMFYGICAGCMVGLVALGNPWFLLGLLGPVLDYYGYKRIRWISLKSGGSTARLLSSESPKDREELFKIKSAITQSISENS